MPEYALLSGAVVAQQTCLEGSRSQSAKRAGRGPRHNYDGARRMRQDIILTALYAPCSLSRCLGVLFVRAAAATAFAWSLIK
eukprot:1435489-Pleurochrysis_carterae.AAC.1